MGSSRKAIHEAAHEAKEFIIAKVILEAGLEGVPLSDIERKMLYFSEVEHEPPDLIEVNEQFEKECDSDEYESKVAGLIKMAYQRDRSTGEDAARRWFDEITALSREDHYILVMVSQADLQKPGDTLRFIGACIATGVALAAFLAFVGNENLQGPELKLAMILFALGVVAVWILASARRRAAAGLTLRMLLPTSAHRGSRKKRGDSSPSKIE